MTKKEKYLTIPEYAKIRGRSPALIYKEIESGKIPEADVIEEEVEMTYKKKQIIKKIRYVATNNKEGVE